MVHKKQSKFNFVSGAKLKKIILDTSTLLYDPLAFKSLKDSDVYIPFSVLEEIDNFKRDMGEKGASARTFHRFMDQLKAEGSLTKGVKLSSGSVLFVCPDLMPSVLPDFNFSQVDHRILATALFIKERSPLAEVSIVSKDINLRIKADVFGVMARDYDPVPVTEPSNFYTGIKKLNIEKKLIQQFRDQGFLSLEKHNILSAKDSLYPHQYIVLRHARDKVMGRYEASKKQIKALYQPSEPIWGVYPRNREQGFALDALMNDDIMFVSLLGKAGTGKTLLALAVGLHKILEANTFQKLLVSRPHFPMGRDMGYLPGDIEQKLHPYMQPIFDSVDFLMGMEQKSARLTQDLLKQGLMHIEPLTYIRGRSIPNQYLIVDEAQNLTPHEVKTILTRAGRGTKVVFTGDGGQIDNPYVDSANNGLAISIEKFKTASLSAHVTLQKGERSELAELSANLL